MFPATASSRNQSLHWSRFLLLTAALAAVLFVGTGASFLHQDAPGTFCSICYAAHLPALRSLAFQAPDASFAVSWFVPAELLPQHATPEVGNSAPRAPPA
jgi:hypothetical protein